MPRVKRIKRKTKKCNSYLYRYHHRGGEGEGMPPEYGENTEENIPQEESWSSPFPQQTETPEQDMYEESPQEQQESSYLNNTFSPTVEQQPKNQFGVPSMGFGSNGQNNHTDSSGISSMDAVNQFVGSVSSNITKPGLKERFTQGVSSVLAKLRNWSRGQPKTETLQTGGTRKQKHSKKRKTQKKRKTSRKTRKH